MTASLNEKLRNVKWGEYKLNCLFSINSSNHIYHANELEVIYENQVPGSFPYVVRATVNNGVRGYIIRPQNHLNCANTLSFAQDTFTVFYQKQQYFTGNKVKVLKPLFEETNANILTFISACVQHSLAMFSWGTGSTVDSISNIQIRLPEKTNGTIDFIFMESFVAELEAERIAELSAYLTVSGLDNYELSKEEEQALSDYSSYDWESFNLKDLYGKSTRGKRLKSEDRIPGTLPFVTAGEAEEGVSAFIGNKVEVFEKNTTTIDMFGSAKYRNYRYGGDDHVAIVHTENVPMKAAIFVTSACHKAAHTGKFDYGHNFYAKDADALDIMLPSKDGKPDYQAMALLISAIQKLVIKDVVQFANRKIDATKHLVDQD